MATTLNNAQVPDKDEYLAKASDVSKKVQDTWNTDAQKQDLETSYARNRSLREKATSPETLQRIYRWYNSNLAKNNPNGNLNNQSFDRTLDASRQADMLNNRQYWKAARIGHRTNSSFGSTGIIAGQAYKYEPVETQETRQMRANEELDLNARKLQQQLAADTQRYPLDMQRMFDEADKDMAKYVATTGVDINKHMQQGVWDKEYGDSFNTYWSNMTTKFSKELDEDLRQRVLNNMAKLEHPFMEIYASLEGGQAPSMLAQWGMHFINAVGSSIEDPKEQMETVIEAVSGLVNMIAHATGEATGEVAGNIFDGLLSSTGGKVGLGVGIGALLLKIVSWLF